MSLTSVPSAFCRHWFGTPNMDRISSWSHGVIAPNAYLPPVENALSIAYISSALVGALPPSWRSQSSRYRGWPVLAAGTGRGTPYRPPPIAEFFHDTSGSAARLGYSLAAVPP